MLSLDASLYSLFIELFSLLNKKNSRPNKYFRTLTAKLPVVIVSSTFLVSTTFCVPGQETQPRGESGKPKACTFTNRTTAIVLYLKRMIEAGIAASLNKTLSILLRLGFSVQIGPV